MTKSSVTHNLKIKLPSELINLLRLATREAGEKNQHLYLVGGVVRDLLLGITNLDLDIVVEGDALTLAKKLAQTKQAKLKLHPRFATATIHWNNWRVDIATARTEIYEKPGTLPIIVPGTIYDDLKRRDFTINAMAINLNPNHYGELLDPYGGINDLNKKFIRIIHNNSFTDDATRIWRGLRYEQRLNFEIEAKTLRLLKRDVPMINTISGDRLRNELELVLKESYPEKIFERAYRLKLLHQIQPSLKADLWLIRRFNKIRDLHKSGLTSSLFTSSYFALLSYRLTVTELEYFIARLRLTKILSNRLREVHQVKKHLALLKKPGLAPYQIFQILDKYSQLAIIANLIATDSVTAQRHLDQFINQLRHIKPLLTGVDLRNMGVTDGSDFRKIITKLYQARIEGRVVTKQDEEYFVEHLMTSH